jgi:endonuclease YncB( thermonuclease family)
LKSRPFAKSALCVATAFLLTAARASETSPLLPPDAGPCSLEQTSRATVASVDAALDVVLADGRVLTLAGLDPPRDTPDHPQLAGEARAALAAWLQGREVAIALLAQKPDRWARIPARLFAPPAGQSAVGEIGVAEAILDAGLARYRPDSAAHPCRDRLLAAEAAARAGGVGLWGDPYYAVLAAASRESFAQPRGGMVIVEGRPTSLGETAARLYLNFGPQRGRDFAITVSHREAMVFEKAGVRLRDLVGHRLRLRGLLDATFGPQIELSDPDALERID